MATDSLKHCPVLELKCAVNKERICCLNVDLFRRKVSVVSYPDPNVRNDDHRYVRLGLGTKLRFQCHKNAFTFPFELTNASQIAGNASRLGHAGGLPALSQTL